MILIVVGAWEMGDWSLQPERIAATTQTAADKRRMDIRPVGKGKLRTYEAGVRRDKTNERLFAVRNPDVLHVRGGSQKVASLGIVGIEPGSVVPGGPRSLHVRRGCQLHQLDAFT